MIPTPASTPAPTPALAVPLIPRPRVPTLWSRVPSVARDLYLLAQPHGGQRAARQNAWGSMSEDADRGRSRAEADEAVAAAQFRSPVRGSQARAASVHGTGQGALEVTG